RKGLSLVGVRLPCQRNPTMVLHRRDRWRNVRCQREPTLSDMNLKQLTTFVRIVEKGSFAAAAEALHTTQSTVSARVKELEHYFGVELFDRSSHRAQLTAKGRELFGMSRHVVGELEQLRDRIADKQALTGTLRLGVVG